MGRIYLTPAQKRALGKRPGAPISSRGTRIVGGEVREDPNVEMLRVKNAQAVYREMEYTDPVISGVLLLIDETMRSARLDLEPADDSPRAGRIMEFASWASNLKALRRRGDKYLAQMLRPLQTFAARGFAYSEILTESVIVPSGRMKGQRRIVLRDLAFCEQAAHRQWVLDDAGENLVGLTQWQRGDPDWTGPARARYGSAEGNVVPIGRMVNLSFRGYGHNYTGVPMLRQPMFAWRAKNTAMEGGAISISRFASPTPMIEVDYRLAEEMGYSAEEIDAEIAAAQENVEGYMNHENEWLMGNAWLKYTVFAASSLNTGSVDEFVKLCDRQIMLGMASQFLGLGIGDVGSRSVGVIHRNVHARFIANLMDQIVQAFSQKVIVPLVAANFGAAIAEKFSPRLVHHDIDGARLGEALGILPGLAQAGIIKRTPQLEGEVLRELAGPESAQHLINAANALPESDRPVLSGQQGASAPGPGRPQGEDG